MTANLDGIAVRIHQLHSDLRLRHTLQQAIAIGGLLAQARAQLAYGTWLPWLRDRVPFLSPRSAQLFIQLSQGRECESDSHLTITKFLRTLRDANAESHVSAHTGDPEWYTPAAYIEASRRVLGEIDLDPASTRIAQKTVKAKRFFSLESDGLAQKWKGNVFLNPPYTADKVAAFVDKLCEHVSARDVSAAILLVNNATETRWFQQALRLATAICFPEGRLRFLGEDGPKGSPLQGQALLYFGKALARFGKEFGRFGCVLAGRKVDRGRLRKCVEGL
jgi:ParB family chromosome partitioning protein